MALEALSGNSTHVTRGDPLQESTCSDEDLPL
jgi:hypothetical protein